MSISYLDIQKITSYLTKLCLYRPLVRLFPNQETRQRFNFEQLDSTAWFSCCLLIGKFLFVGSTICKILFSFHYDNEHNPIQNPTNVWKGCHKIQNGWRNNSDPLPNTKCGICPPLHKKASTNRHSFSSLMGTLVLLSDLLWLRAFCILSVSLWMRYQVRT